MYHGNSHLTTANLVRRLAEQGGELARKLLQFVAQPDPTKARDELVSELGYTIAEYAEIAAQAWLLQEAETEAKEKAK